MKQKIKIFSSLVFGFLMLLTLSFWVMPKVSLALRGNCIDSGGDGCVYDSNPCTDQTWDVDNCSCTVTYNSDPCNDGNACTENDSCSNGSCSGTALDCNKGNECKNYSCNTSTGCVETNKSNGSSCNGFLSCSTTTFSCSNGSCTGSSPVVCTAKDACHTAGSCSTQTTCQPNGTCTDGPVCSDIPINIDDGDACTTDSCDTTNGVQHINQPVDGGWSSWNCGTWGSCLNNVQSRTCTRTCDNPSPACNGNACSGSNTEVQTQTCGQCTANQACGTSPCGGTQYCTSGVLSACDYSASNGNSCNSGSGVCSNGSCNASVCGNGVPEGNETCDAGSANNGACPKTCGSNCQTNICLTTPPSTGGTSTCATNQIECGSNCCNNQSQVCNSQTLTCVNRPVVNCLSNNDCNDNNGCTIDVCGADGKCDYSQGQCYKCSTTPSTNGFGTTSYCKGYETSGQTDLQACGYACSGGSSLPSFSCNNTCYPSTAFGACRQLNTSTQCIESNGGLTHYYQVTYTGTVCDGFKGNPVDPNCTTSGCACVQTACTYTAQQTTPGVWNSDIFPGSCSGAGTATCSNLVVETGEQCDDGNLISGDGCSASCQLENNLYINSIPVSQDVAKGNSAVYAIDANYTGASITNAKFTVSNCPVGSTCTFANGSNNQTTPFNVSKLANVILTVTSSSNSAVANNTLNVKVENAVCAGQNGCLSANTNINFNILSPTITNASSCLNITAPDTVNAGASFNYSVTTKNVGSSTWHSSSPNKYGITAWPRSNYVFGDQVLVLPVATVATNSNATFTASATAPVNPPAKGCTLVSNNLYSCPFSFRMWQDWVEWFGPICSKNINVSVSPPTVSLTINNKSQENIDRGGSGTFSWTTSNANACVALGSQGNWTTTSSGIPIATNGSASTGTLTQPGWWSYSISCSNNFGVTNDEVWIFVPDCNEPPSLVSSSVTPATVAPGGSYSIGCNYGTQTNSINPVPSSGTCSFMGWSGTGANFACTAPNTPGNYPNLCTIGTNSLGQADIKSPNYYCKRDSGINNTVVQILKPTISLGSISPFNAISGGSTPAPQNLSISNTGNTTLNWTYSSVGTGSWCSISPTSGTIPAGGTASVAVSVSAPTTVGSFNNCIIRISDPNATNNPQNLTVIYNVSPTDPTGVSATLATCPSRAVTVAWQANSGATSYTVYRNTTNDATTAVVLQAGLTGLSYVDSPVVGTYYYFVSAQNGSLSSSRTASSNNPVGVTACAGNDVPVAVAKISTTNSNFQPSITVSQGVATPIYLSAADSSDPDGWTNSSYGMSGGGAKCEWNRDLNQGAPTFENPSINNPNSASACNISLGSLTFNDAPGTYTYQVLRLTDRANGVSNVASVSVTVVSGPKPTINLDPPSFIFNAETQGATPASQQLRIRNTGNAVLNWTFSRTGVGTWCNLSVASGTLNPGSTAYTNVTVNSPSNVGSFNDCGIRISDANATNSPQDASVTYNVTSPLLGVDLLAATDGAANGSGSWAQSLTAFDPLTTADFRAVLSGTATVGTGVYTFYCNRADNGTNITAGYDSQTTTAASAINLLNRCASVYLTPGVYTAKMIVQKQGASAEDRLTVTVNNSKGSINVRYSLDGIDQASSATINYGITGPTNITTGNYTVSGSSVHSNVSPGSYTLTYNSGGPANAFINPNNPITPTANQTVSANSSITYILNFLSKPGPVCPSGSCCPGGTNSSATCGGGGGGGYTGVACRTIKINWTDGSTNEDGFYVYANQTGNVPSTSAEKVAQRIAIVTTTSKAGTNQAYTHTYSAGNTNPYYFWVSAFNNGGAGESALMPMSNNPVAANDCTANIVSSDKDMITVAGVNPTATACNGTAEGTYIGTTPVKFFGGNTITFAINVCNNNNSFYDAQDVIVTDYLTNLRKPNSGWNTKSCTGAGGSGTCTNITPSEAGTSPNQTLTFSIGNVLLGQVKSILVTAEIAPAPLGSTSRFNNRAIIDYLKEDGSRSNRQASTPWLPYFSATSTPSRIEIPGR